jgi:hypothetical protein
MLIDSGLRETNHDDDSPLSIYARDIVCLSGFNLCPELMIKGRLHHHGPPRWEHPRPIGDGLPHQKSFPLSVLIGEEISSVTRVSMVMMAMPFLVRLVSDLHV